MPDVRRAVRFFRILRPVPRLIRVAFTGITVASAIAVLAPHERETRLLLPLLALQMFTVSTGFIRDARRGHFDVLLTSGVPRGEAAMVYWALAALPGVTCCMMLALVDLSAHGHTGLLRPGSLAAIVSVSTIPWAATVPLSRFTGSIGWLLALVILTGLPPLGQAMERLWVRSAGESREFGALAFLLFPARLVGEPFHDNASAILCVLTLALLGMCSATAWISWTDVALETGQ
jgi:hypothetical protein